MSKRKPQALMFYPEAWKSSPAVAAMTPAERSGYFEILLSMWLAGGSLPDDDRALAAASRLDSRVWRKSRGAIRAELRPTTEGRLTQPRLAEEYERTIQLQAKLRTAGREGAHRRWQNRRSDTPPNSRATGHPNREATGHPNSPPNRGANAIAMQTETETETKSSGGGERFERPGASPPASQPAAGLDPVLDAIGRAAGRRPSPGDLPPDLALLVAEHGPEPVVEWIELRSRQGVRSPGLFLQPSVLKDIRAHCEQREEPGSQGDRRADAEVPDHYPPADLEAALAMPGGQEAFRDYCRGCGWVDSKCRCGNKSA